HTRGGCSCDPLGGIFSPPKRDRGGHSIKYLPPRRAACRLFYPLITLEEMSHGRAPLWLVEGEKKSLAVAQLGLPAVGFCGVEGWHLTGSRTLLPDFEAIPLQHRVVGLRIDGDVDTNPQC